MKKRGPSNEKPKPEGRALTPLQEAFIREYLIDKNGTQAAIRAGYSDNPASAAQQAYENLRKPEIRSTIRRQLKAYYERLDITPERVLHELMLLATADIGDAYDEDGKLLPIKKIPQHIRRAISSIEDGENIKIKLAEKRGPLELLAKNLKLLTEKHEVTGKDGAPFGELSDEQVEARFQALIEKAKGKK